MQKKARTVILCKMHKRCELPKYSPSKKRWCPPCTPSSGVFLLLIASHQILVSASVGKIRKVPSTSGLQSSHRPRQQFFNSTSSKERLILNGTEVNTIPQQNETSTSIMFRDEDGEGVDMIIMEKGKSQHDNNETETKANVQAGNPKGQV